MRTYWCGVCEKLVDIDMKSIPECKWGHVFGASVNISDYINMRKTWSGQTKVEFSQTTVAESVKKMGGDINR